MVGIQAVHLVITIPIFLTFCVVFFLAWYMPKRDIEQCEAIIKKNSLTFYQAFSKIKNKKQREAIYAVYAFCRYADDLIDEYQDIEGLKRLESELLLFKEGITINHFRWRALRKATKSFYPKNYDYQPYFDMIKGQKMDIDVKEYKTETELLNYCYHVAGTVGLMLIPILSKENYLLLNEFAINLGYGMQITNILRDIGEDYKNHRVYLPKDLMKLANYSIEDLSMGKISSEFIHLFEDLAKKAETYFQGALDELYLFDKEVRVPLGLSIILYREIINACREAEYDVFTKKNYVSDQRKNVLIQEFINAQSEEIS
jgi:phytoene synthase